MDKIRDIFLYFVAAMTMFSMLGAVYQAFNDQKGSALTLGTLFLVGSLIVFIPQLEVIKMLGVEAKLRQAVTEAQASLESFKRLSAVSAKSTYMSFAWANRFGTPGAKVKQAILDEVDRQIAELKISDVERQEIVKPWVVLIGWDFFQMYITTIGNYIEAKHSEVANKLSTGEENAELRALLQRWHPLLSQWREKVRSDGLYQKMLRMTFVEFMNEMNPPDGLLDKAEAEKERSYRNEIIALYSACQAKGGYTDKAADYVDEYNPEYRGDKKLIKRVFGYDMK